MSDMEKGFYMLHIGDEAPVLVMGYESSDCGEFVFGFNTHDGGGVLPLSHLDENATFKRVMFVELDPQ